MWHCNNCHWEGDSVSLLMKPTTNGPIGAFCPNCNAMAGIDVVIKKDIEEATIAIPVKHEPPKPRRPRTREPS